MSKINLLQFKPNNIEDKIEMIITNKNILKY